MIENREQQIKSASEIIAYGCSDELKAALIQDFPELNESEDERIRKFLLDYAIEMIAGLESDISLSTYDGIKGHDPDAEAELTQWQKARGYLEKQKEQQPAEWSEEDEDVIHTIEIALGTSKTVSHDNYLRVMDWLKSLRPQPHWKPSEEQMFALDNAILMFHNQKRGGDKEMLESLYNELKKLNYDSRN